GAAARAEMLAVPVLAPVGFGGIPGDPEAAGAIARQRYVGVVAGRSRDLPALVPLAVAAELAHEDVEVAVVVAVPPEPAVPVAIGGRCRQPGVGVAGAHLHLGRPRLAVPRLRQDLRPTVAEALPYHVQFTVRITHHRVVEIGTGIAGDALR